MQPMEFSRPEYWSEQPFPSAGDLPNPGMEPRSPASQADSSPTEPQGKPKNTGVGSLSLLQGIFPTQVLNPGLPGSSPGGSREFEAGMALARRTYLFINIRLE